MVVVHAWTRVQLQFDGEGGVELTIESRARKRKRKRGTRDKGQGTREDVDVNVDADGRWSMRESEPSDEKKAIQLERKLALVPCVVSPG